MNFDIKGDISCLLIETLCVTVFACFKKKNLPIICREGKGIKFLIFFRKNGF